MFPLTPNPDLARRFEAISDRVEVVWAPYFESSELRTSRGHNQGKDPLGLDRPVLDDSAMASLGRAQAVVGMDLPDDIAALAPNLRLWQGIGAGYDHIDGEALAAMGAVQCNASGIASIPIAEFVIGRLLQVWKHLRELDASQERHEWEIRYGRQLAGCTIGIVGLGAIGREIARRARAFDMTVLASRGSAKPGDVDPDVDELFPAADADEMLARSDAVVLALPATPESEGFIDARRLALLPEGAVLVNVARGMHVVEPDLIDALESGHLGAAVLDVTRNEPLPSDDSLWDAPNLYLSPHSSVSLDRYEATVVELAAANIGAFIDARPMQNVVNDPRQ